MVAQSRGNSGTVLIFLDGENQPVGFRLALEQPWTTFCHYCMWVIKVMHHFTILKRTSRFPSACLALLALAFAASVSAQKVPVTEVTLDNGMKMLMVERHDEPSVS